MDVQLISTASVIVENVGYHFSDGSYVLKDLHAYNNESYDIAYPKLLEFTYFDFDLFNEADITAEGFTCPDFTLSKIAVPAGVVQIDMVSFGSSRFRLYPNERERMFNCVVTLIQLQEDGEVHQLDIPEEVMIHEMNLSNPHADQVKEAFPAMQVGVLLGKHFIINTTNRYNGVVAGTTLMTDDGCKYWLGNFDGHQF